MSSTDVKKIRAVMIMEVIGKPPEYLTETLENIYKNIDGEKGVHVVEKRINEPILMKEQKEFYTSFAELEVEVEEILQLASLMLKYMPAHIEIISPELIALTNNGWNDILNETVRRLHGYDEIARIVQTEKIILENKLRDLTKNLELRNIHKEENNEEKKEEIKKDDKKKGKKKN